MKFKVGDRIKIVNFHDEGINGSTGTVSEIRPTSEFPYKVIWSSVPKGYGENIVLNEKEVESTLRKGEQLLLAFML